MKLLSQRTKLHRSSLKRHLRSVGIENQHMSRLVTKTTKCATSEDSDQPGHPPSLIRVFAIRMKKVWVLSYPMSAQRRR